MNFVSKPLKKAPLRPVIGGDGPDGASSDRHAEPDSRHPSLVLDEPAEAAREEKAADLEDTPESIEEKARQAGFEKGYREGLEAGRREGFEQGHGEGQAAGEQALRERLAREQAQAQSLIQALVQPLATLRGDLAEAIADGAQRLARLLVGAVVETDTQALTSIVNDILAEATDAGGQHYQLRLHVPPEDHEAVQALAGSRGAEILADEQLKRGDVRATLAKNNGDPVHQIEWDARLETRWEAIRKALGLSHS